MKRNKFGKFILSFVLVVGAIVSTAVDWNTTHLFNPAWPPHARFHDALFLMFVDATTLIMLWLLWRRSSEPAVGIKAVALYSAALFNVTEGRAYSGAEYRAMLKSAGLEPGDVIPTAVHCGVLAGTKR